MRTETQTKDERPVPQQESPDALSSVGYAVLVTKIQPDGSPVEGVTCRRVFDEEEGESVEFLAFSPQGSRELSYEHVWPEILRLENAGKVRWSEDVATDPLVLKWLQDAACNTMSWSSLDMSREDLEIVFIRLLRMAFAGRSATELTAMTRELLRGFDAVSTPV